MIKQSFFYFTLIFVLTASPLFAQEAAESYMKVATETVQYNNGEKEVSAYVAKPTGEGPFPAIILIHEWWGLTDWVKDNAKQFAENGYYALAVDLYRGKTTDDPNKAHEMMRGLPDDQAMRDITGGFKYLLKQENIQQDNIGCIGWCMGGGYALKAAMEIEDLAAAVVCYGRLSTDREELDNIYCPILGIFGSEDDGIPVDTVLKFEDLAESVDKEVEIHIYEGVGHAFMRKYPGFDQTQQAWEEIKTFFSETLKQVDYQP